MISLLLRASRISFAFTVLLCVFLAAIIRWVKVEPRERDAFLSVLAATLTRYAFHSGKTFKNTTL